MRMIRMQLAVLAGLLVALAAGAQATGPGAPLAQRGFSSQQLVTQLSLYLPEEATRGMYRGFGRANGPGAQGAPSGQAGQGAQPGGGFAPLQIPRDPKLYLTKDQITGLLPILIALRDNPLPTPSKAKEIQADVDSKLTPAQKAEWTEFQKKLQDLIAQFRQQMAANGAGANGAGANGAGGPGANGDAAAQGGGQGQQGGPQMTVLQRRQKQLDAFIKVLQDRLKGSA